MTTNLTRTGGTPTNTNKYTWSAWIKRGKLSVGETIIYNYYDGNDRGYISFDASDKLFFYDRDTSEQNNCYSTRLLRDTCGWYHVHVLADTTQSSAGDRFKVHINGVLETLTGTTLDQNDALGFKVATGTNQLAIGTNGDSTANPFTGLMSYIYYVDGLAIAHTQFGETDSTTGEWKIKLDPTISAYGDNGYFILKDGNSVTDQSGEGNNFTVSNGTLTKTEDCPSNIFATINPLDNRVAALTLTNGNTSWSTDTAYGFCRSTLGASKGKYYFEMKVLNQGDTDYEFGIAGNTSASSTDWLGKSGTYGYSYESSGKLRMNGTDTASWGATYDDNDILGCAFDLDNNKLYFSKNGTWQNSANPSNGTNGETIPASADVPNGAYFVGTGDFSGNAGQTGSYNFGNGYFGTTIISSAGTNASGIGIFEYDVPTNFTALSTKGLNE